MKPRRNPNTTEVAHDCMCFYMACYLKKELDFAVRRNTALSAMADAMAKIIAAEIPADTMERIRRSHFVTRMDREFAAHGLSPFTCFQILNQL